MAAPLEVVVPYRNPISGPQGMLTLAWEKFFRNLNNFIFASATPVGAVISFAGSTAPDGFLMCYGQAVSRTDYDALFEAIGVTFGMGDGSSTFNLPDLRGRVAAGKDDMGGSAASRLTSAGSGVDGATLGASGGAETHTLTVAQLASHFHVIQRPTTSIAVGGTFANGSSHQDVNDNSNPTGGDEPHNNTQPTFVMNMIIKY